MKMKRKLALALLLVLVGGTGCNNGNTTTTTPTSTPTTTPEVGSLEFYQELSDNLDIVQVIDSSELTLDTLRDRSKNGNLIIEKIIGEVVSIDTDGTINGKVLNSCVEGNDYIAYTRVEGAKVGNVILTYCLYSPDSRAEDDVIERFDYIIDSKETNNKAN